MAAGYATFRPPVHPRVIEQAYRGLKRSRPFRNALDIGCGAGVSTRALDGFADHRIGLDPAEAMLRRSATIAAQVHFVVGAAEAIPVRDSSIDLITAAGSLNYADLSLFFPEAARVLMPKGVLMVYDFLPGKSFRDSNELDRWFSEFEHHYPPPPNEARELSPKILAQLDSGFRVQSYQNFEIGIALTPDFYLNYMMTETNVAAAVRRGVPSSEVRSWCAETLTPVWNCGEREVLFRGYFACMTASR